MDMWDAWVTQKMERLAGQLASGDSQRALMAELDGWEEVLGPERLMREMTQVRENQDILLVHLLRQPFHRSRVRRGVRNQELLQGLLAQALMTGDVPLLEGLLAVGLSPNGNVLPTATWNELPLAQTCVDQGSAAATAETTHRMHELLIAAGANINHYTDWRSLLHSGAVMKNNLSWAQWLFDHGAHMPTRNHEGRRWTSLDFVRHHHQALLAADQASPWAAMLQLLETQAEAQPLAG
jgi:hypothetical protein